MFAQSLLGVTIDASNPDEHRMLIYVQWFETWSLTEILFIYLCICYLCSNINLITQTKGMQLTRKGKVY